MNEWHELYSGKLSDMPGRNETWTEYVRYRHRGQWTLSIDGTDFSGMLEGEEIHQRFGTRSLIEYVLERDSEEESADDETASKVGAICEDERILGPRALRLLEIATAEKATYCFSLLNRYKSGDWSPGPRPPRILGVIEARKRGVWLHVYHAVFVVNTSAGEAFLYPPDLEGMSTLILMGSNTSNREFKVRITKKIKAQLEGLRSEFEKIKNDLR